MTSSFPAAENPGVAVDVYRGDLGMEGGRSQSVFAIDIDQVDKGAAGQAGAVEPDGGRVDHAGRRHHDHLHRAINEWVSLQTSYDPAQLWALVFAVFLLAGLMVSLVFKRRRVWFRIRPAVVPAVVPAAAPARPAARRSGAPPPPSGGRADRTVVEVGGLARTDQAGYGEEFAPLAALARPDRSGPDSNPGRSDDAVGWRSDRGTGLRGPAPRMITNGAGERDH